MNKVINAGPELPLGDDTIEILEEACNICKVVNWMVVSFHQGEGDKEDGGFGVISSKHIGLLLINGKEHHFLGDVYLPSINVDTIIMSRYGYFKTSITEEEKESIRESLFCYYKGIWQSESFLKPIDAEPAKDVCKYLDDHLELVRMDGTLYIQGSAVETLKKLREEKNEKKKKIIEHIYRYTKED